MHDDLSRALASLRAHDDSGTSDYALLRKQEILSYVSSGFALFFAFRLGASMQKAIGSGYWSLLFGLLGLAAAVWLVLRGTRFTRYCARFEAQMPQDFASLKKGDSPSAAS